MEEKDSNYVKIISVIKISLDKEIANYVTNLPQYKKFNSHTKLKLYNKSVDLQDKIIAMIKEYIHEIE